VFTGLLACLAVLGTGVTFAAAAPPRGFFSTQDWSMPSLRDLQRMHQGGVGTLRAMVHWGAVTPKSGIRNWDDYDALFARAAQSQIRVLPVLMGSPYFNRHSPSPPRSASRRRAYAAFVRDAVERYGRGGVFWRERPDLPYLPAVAWQIWNEPNFPVYWGGHPNPAQYVALVKAAHAAVTSRDRRAKVVLGGLPETALGVPMVSFLTGVYAVRGARRAFDAVAIHPYARDQRGVFGAIRRVRAVMRRAGDSRKALWITEVGWASGGKVTRNTSPFKTSERGQAERLRKTLSLLVASRHRYHVGLVSWFSWRDRGRRPGERDWWAIHTGLLRRDGRAKPAWRSYGRLTRRR
jgi:hypothetical protein